MTRGEMHPAFRNPRDPLGRDIGLPSEDFSDLVREVKRPPHFQYEPNHFQRTQNIKEVSKTGPITPKVGEFSVTKPCFGLDYEREEIGIDEVARGYKVGGPKEARLFRVALLAAKKDTDHLYPVKVSGVHDMIKEEELYEVFGRFGSIGDVYVPRKGENRKLVAPFGIVRFIEREGAAKAVLQGKLIMKTEFCGPDPFTVSMSHIQPQESIFTRNTGVHGITNVITEDMRDTEKIQNAKKEDVTQVITLDECFSRSGYPWGSKRELKMLNVHAPKEVMDHYNIKVSNLNERSSPQAIREAFEILHDVTVGDVFCPQTLIITERDKRREYYNDGFAYVRFPTKHDLNIAWQAVSLNFIKVDDRVLRAC